MSNQFDFSDIAPFGDDEFKSKMAQLVNEPGFEHAVKYAGCEFPRICEYAAAGA